jgi:hypothetical protein
LAKVGGNFVTDIPAAIDSGTGVSGTDRLMTFTLGGTQNALVPFVPR